MKATCWMGPQKMQVREVPDPQILNKRDAIVKITSTAICGSDLHLYDGYVPTMKRGDILGHEFMGEIVRSDGAPQGTKSAARQLTQRPAKPLKDKELEKVGGGN